MKCKLILVLILAMISPLFVTAQAEQVSKSSTINAIKIDFSEPILDRIAKRVQANLLTLNVPQCREAPVMDGLAGEELWNKAAVIKQLNRGGALTTTVRICHNRSHLFIHVTCKDQPGRELKIKEDRRDGKAWDDDCIEIRIQPLARNAPQYHFVVNAAGVIYDAAEDDTLYNPDWSSSVKRGENEWSLEVAIPAAAVGLTEWQKGIGFNIGRNIPVIGNQSWNPGWDDTLASRLILEGGAEVSKNGGEEKLITSPNLAVSGSSIAVKLDRPYARPGDRYVETSVQLSPRKLPLSQTRLDLKLYALAGDSPIERLSIVPTNANATVSIDVRGPKLEMGELTIELFEGEERTGLARAFISAMSAPLLEKGKKIPVGLDVPEGVGELKQWPVTFGAPFAAGVLWNANNLRLVNKSGREIPCQKEVNGLWSRDGAVKWVRFDALVTPSEECFVEIAGPGKGAQPDTPLRLTEQGDEIIVETGSARYVLGKGNSPIKQIWLEGKMIATSGKSRGLYIVDQTGRVAIAAMEEETMLIESKGPVAACVRFEGWYMTEKKEKLARHITRVECFAGQPAANITHTLILTRDSNETWFKEIGWELAVAPGASPQALFGLSPQEHEKQIAVPLEDKNASAYMIQDSHFFFAHSTNHFSVAKTGSNGKNVIIFEGEAAPKKKDKQSSQKAAEPSDLSAIAQGAKEEASAMEGGECGDWAALAGKEGGLQVVCRDAARQHPKEFEIYPDKIILKLFSNRAGEELDFRTPTLVKKWDLKNWAKIAGTSPEQRSESYVEKARKAPSNAIGWSKSHRLLFNPLASGKAQAQAARASKLHHDPVYALIDSKWIYESGAMGPLYPKDVKRFPDAERAQEAAMRWWIETDRKWGENGFIDYFAGPHLDYTYKGDYVIPYRYCYCTYTLRANIWRIYARSGTRVTREFCEGTTMSFMDNIHMHWNESAKSGLARGLFRGHSFFDLPFYWGNYTTFEISSSTDFNNYIWFYHLTGNRRARDIVEEYANGIKQVWTPSSAKRTSRILMLMRLLAQCYETTWDTDLCSLAEATTDLFQDNEGELLLSKDRSYNSSSYKTQVDIRALIDAWEILGNPRYREMALKITEFWWRAELGTAGFGYNIPMAVAGNFLYSQTGEPRYAQAMDMSVRHMTATYDPKTEVFAPRTIQGAHSTSFIFELDTALDVLVRSGADKKNVTSWAGFGDLGNDVKLILQKPKKSIADLYFRTPAAIVNCLGDISGVRVRPLNPKSTWGQDLTSVHATSGGTGVVRVPKDAPAGAYEITFLQKGDFYIFMNGKFPLVLYAPYYWTPMPKQVPAARYFFSLPKESKDAQIFFEGQAKLFDPDGQPFGNEGLSKGWVILPPSKPGLWAFEPFEQAKAVRVRNIPPFFAFGDPATFFTPEIPWTQESLPEPAKEIPPDTVYVPGIGSSESNKAVYLTGKRCLQILAGTNHPSGDGSMFLPFKEGTVEFFMKPAWNTVELADVQKKLCFGRMKKSGGSNYYIFDYSPARKELFAFLTQRLKNGEGQGVRDYRRQTMFERDKWVHVALVWGKGSLSTYIDGKRGLQNPGGMEGPPFSPMSIFMIGYERPELNIDAVVDELRISDITRYEKDFIPPSRDSEFMPNKNTRLLMHFNGNLDAQSFGHEGPVPVKLTP